MSHPEIKESYRVERPEQALALLNPLRAEILRLHAEPASAAETARRLREPPQKINYHLKALEKVGLVRRAGERHVRNLVEVLYVAVARTFIIPDEFGWSEETLQRMKMQGALRQVLNLAERIRGDAACLMEAADAEGEVPSAALEAVVHLPDAASREAFLRDYAEAVRRLAERYSGDRHAGGYRIMTAIYPILEEGDGHGKNG
jgi:DNA-binding transcriptional ArsR family regulator